MTLTLDQIRRKGLAVLRRELALVAQLVEKFDDFPRHFLQICWFFGSGNPVLAM